MEDTYSVMSWNSFTPVIGVHGWRVRGWGPRTRGAGRHAEGERHTLLPSELTSFVTLAPVPAKTETARPPRSSGQEALGGSSRRSAPATERVRARQGIRAPNMEQPVTLHTFHSQGARHLPSSEVSGCCSVLQ